MATTSFVLVPPTGMQAAIEAHRAAWVAYQVAPAADVDWDAAANACDDMDDALERLVGTPCLSRADAEALRDYLRWYVNAERATRNWSEGIEAVALARAVDLSLLLRGDLPVTEAAPADLTLGFLVSRVLKRVSLAGEAITCAGLIAGGMVLIGHASLIG